MVPDCPVYVHIEWQMIAFSLNLDHSAGPQCVSNTQFVPDVRIVDGKVDHHQIRKQEFLKHVGPDVACPQLLISAKHLEPGALECGLDQVGVHKIKVNAFFDSVWHRHKCMNAQFLPPSTVSSPSSGLTAT